MKKIFIILLALSILVPSVAMAATTTAAAIEATTPTAGAISVLSNKVTMIYFSSGNLYAAASGHESGSKVYASGSADTKIYQKTEDPPVLTGEISTSVTDQFTGTGWTAM